MSLPTASASSSNRDLLILQPTVWEAQIDLGRPVAAQLSTKRAPDDDIIFRELLCAGRDRARALLAAHDIDGRIHPVRPAAAQHGSDAMAKVGRKSNRVVVDGINRTTGSGDAPQIVQEDRGRDGYR